MVLQALLTAAAAGRGWPLAIDGPTDFRIEIPLPSGRTQVVSVTQGTDADNMQMVFIWSASASIAFCPDTMGLMNESLMLSYGSYCIKDGNIIVKTSRVLQYTNADDITRALYYIGLHADELEKRLLGPAYDAS